MTIRRQRGEVHEKEQTKMATRKKQPEDVEVAEHLAAVWEFESDEQKQAMLEPITKKNCGRKLRLVRDVSGLSREELAKAIGVSESTIYRLERGETAPTDDFMLRLASLVAIGHAKYSRMSEKEKGKLSEYLGAAVGISAGVRGAIAAVAASQLVGRLSAAGITSGLAAVASGMLEGLATIATLPIAAGAAGYRFVKNLKAICDANRLRCEEVDGRYEIVRARPAAKESEPTASDGAN